MESQLAQLTLQKAMQEQELQLRELKLKLAQEKEALQAGTGLLEGLGAGA